MERDSRPPPPGLDEIPRPASTRAPPAADPPPVQLLRHSERADGGSLVQFRTSSIGAGVMSVLFVGFLAAALWFALHLWETSATLGRVLLVPAGGIVLLLLWIVAATTLASLRATFLTTNWTMLVGKGGVWLNLRSYMNHAFEEHDDTACFVPFAELRGARRFTETTPGRGEEHGSVRRWLELFVRAGVDLVPLADAVRREAARRGPESSLLGVRSSGRALHAPVSVLGDDCIRVDWHGRRMLSALRDHGVELWPDRSVRSDDPAPEGVDARVLELLAAGRELEAVRLLRRVSGMELAEARTHVRELAARTAA